MLNMKMMTFDNKSEWLEYRSKRIGGSDASAVVGMNPYMTNVDLWEFKTGRRVREDISEKPYVKYGVKAEEHLRELFRLDYPEYQLDYIAGNLWLNDDYPFAHASLDGWLTDEQGRTGVLEIKTTNIFNSNQKEKWNGRIPQNYYIQLLHYMMVMNADFSVLKAQLKWKLSDGIYMQTKHYFIERADVQEDIDYLIEAEKEFYKAIADDKEPMIILPEQ